MINVLIVEDDFRIADIHEKFLEGIDGVQVIGKAYRAAEAIHFVKENQVDLVLVDIYLPDKLGTELIHEMKGLNIDLHFIVITAANNMSLLDFSLKSGVFYYLIKPVSLEKFKDIIEKFKSRNALIASRDSVDQQLIDRLLGDSYQKANQTNHDSLPKGVNLLTLNKIIKALDGLTEGVTAEEMGEKLGASRTTARRYLEYLVSKGEVRAELEYGIVGRPERRYFHHAIQV